MKKFTIYALRWETSTPVIALCLWLLPFNTLVNTVIANFIGAVIFFKVDALIFNKGKKTVYKSSDV
jgi:hypothetical protein